MQRRQEVCGDAYPFSLARGRLTWRNPGSWRNPYIVCLLASDREQYRAGDDTAKVFEHLTTLALRAFLDGKAVRFGAPRDTMPTPINEALGGISRDDLCADHRRVGRCSPLIRTWGWT